MTKYFAVDWYETVDKNPYVHRDLSKLREFAKENPTKCHLEGSLMGECTFVSIKEEYVSKFPEFLTDEREGPSPPYYYDLNSQNVEYEAT